MTPVDLSPLDRHLVHGQAVGEGLRQVWSVLPEARLVGGVVRDLIAGHTMSDIDLATPEPPLTVMRRLADAGIRTIATGLAHGTVTALPRGSPIEITTLRRDQETDGRHAVVAWTADWREDAQRRDFTINAMSLARDRTLFDYFGGADDLAAGRVRFVGEAALRIAEDALRILRFFRFEARFGCGAPDAAATAAIEDAVPALDRLSAERVWSELRRILVGPGPARTIELMRGLGVLDRLLPGGTTSAALARLLPAGLPADPVLRLASLLDGPAAPVAQALRLSGAEAVRLETLGRPPVPVPEMDDAELRRLLADEAVEVLDGRAWLAEAAGGGDTPRWAALRRRLADMPAPVFPLAGRDVLACGVPAGPEVGRLLARVRDWWRADGCVAGRVACLDHLRALMRSPT